MPQRRPSEPRRSRARSGSPADRRRRRRTLSESRSPRRSRSREVAVARPRSPASARATALAAQQPQPQAPGSAASAAVPEWLADLFGGEPQPQPQASAAIPLEIPLHLAPLITPMVLAGIRAASGAEVALREDMQHYGYSLAIITGTPQAVALARAMMQQNLGLAGESSNIVREIEVSGDPMVPIGAVELAQAELRLRASGVPMSIVPPQGPNDKGRVIIGPGPVAHVNVAETFVRKKLADMERELCYRQGRPVPLELKIPAICKYFTAGSCSLANKCQYCHTPEEVEIVRRISAEAKRKVAGGVARALPPPREAPGPVDNRTIVRTSETSALL